MVLDTEIPDIHKKETWSLNEYVFHVQIQAVKSIYSDSSLDTLW